MFSLDDLTGTLTSDERNKAFDQNAVGPNANAYQIAGLGDYTSTLKGLAPQIPGSADFSATAPYQQNQSDMLDYLKGVYTGKTNTAADNMLQQSQQANAAQLQSGVLGANSSVNPALALRALIGGQTQLQGQTAGQLGLQKVQEQAQARGEFANLNQQGYANQFTMAQQNFNNKMASIQAQEGIANDIFGANKAQTSYNVALDQGKQAYGAMKYQERTKAMEDEKRNRAALYHGIATGLGTAAGAVAGTFLGGPGAGTALGASLGGSLVGGIVPGPGGSSGGGTDYSAMLMQMSQQNAAGAAGPQVFKSPGNTTGTGGLTEEDAMYAQQMASQGYVGG